MNTNKIATRSINKKLLAALAVLAVAIVALAAIPAAAVDSSDAEVPTSESGDAQIVLNGVGLIAPDSADSTGYGAQTNSAAILAALDGSEDAYTYDSAPNMLIVSSDFPEGTTKIVWTVTDGSFTKSESLSTGASIPTLAGTISWYDAYGSVVASWQTDEDGDAGDGANDDAEVPAESQYSFDKEYTLTIEATVGSDIYTKTVTWSGEGFAIYSGDVDISTLLTSGYVMSDDAAVFVKAGASFTGTLGQSNATVAFTNAVAVEDTVITAYSQGVTIDGYLRTVDVMEIDSSTGVPSATTEGAIELTGGLTLADGATLAVASADDVTSSSSGSIVLGKSAQIVEKADARTPVVLAAGSDGATVTFGTDLGTTLALTVGDLTIASGSLEIEAGDTLQTSVDTTLTIASGAALKIDNGASQSAATFSASGTVVREGILALTSAADPEATSSGSSAATTWSATGITLLDDDSTAVLGDEDGCVEAFNITSSTDPQSTSDTIGYEGEEISAVFTTDESTVISQAGYKLTDSASTADYSAYASKDSSKTTYTTETWYFTMPAAAVTIVATTGGAYTATFILVDENGDSLHTTYVSNPYTDVKVPVPAITYPGYVIGSIYTDSSLSTSVEYDSTEATIELNQAQSAVFYVKMAKLYSVTYNDAEGGSVDGSRDVQANTPVTVAVTVEEGYQIADGQIAVTDADGNVVAVSSIVSSSTQTSGFSGPYTEGTYYVTFVMPASDVTVKAEFDKLYALEVEVLDNTVETGYGTVSITKVDGAAQDNLTNSTDAISEVYIEGTAIVFTVSDIADGFGISEISLVDGDGTAVLDIISKYDADSSVYTASFLMPASDVTLEITYGAVHTLTLNVPTNGSITAASTDGDLSTDDAQTGETTVSNEHIAVGTAITLTLTPEDDYGLVSVTYTIGSSTVPVDPAENDDGTYSFDMPDADATVTATFGALQTLAKLDFTGYGYASYDKDDNTTAAPGSIGFTVVPTVNSTVEYEVATVSVYKADSTASSGYSDTASDIYTYLTNENSASAGVTVSHVGNEYSLDFDSTVTEPTSYRVAVTFTPVVYYTVTVSSGSMEYVTLYTTYEEGELSDEIELDSDNQASVRSGTRIYINVADTEQQTNLVRIAKTSSTGTSLDLTSAGVERIQYFTLSDNTTVYAGYEAYTFVVTIDDAIENGTIKVYNGETEIESGTAVPYDTTLTIVPAGDDGYGVKTVSVNGTEIEDEGNGYTTTVELQNVLVSATFQEVYAIEVADLENGSVEPSVTEAPADAEVTLTVNAGEGYVLTVDSLKATDADDNNVELTPNDDGTYSFTMPASKVTVTASFETDPSAVASKNIRVTVTNDNENEVVVLLQSRDGGYIPSGTVTLTITFQTAAGYYDYVELTGTYTADGTATYYEVTLAPSEAQLASIVAGSGVSGYATFVGGSIAPVSLTAGLNSVFVGSSEEASA